MNHKHGEANNRSMWMKSKNYVEQTIAALLSGLIVHLTKRCNIVTLNEIHSFEKLQHIRWSCLHPHSMNCKTLQEIQK